MDLLREPYQEIDRLELEFISYNIRELKSMVLYQLYITVDWFFSRFVLSGVGLPHLIQSSAFWHSTDSMSMLPSKINYWP